MQRQNTIKKTCFKSSFFIFFLMFSFCHSFAFARCIDDICFSEKIGVVNEDFILKGIGLLEYLKLDLYVAALYLPPEEVNTKDVLDSEVSKKLIIYYKRGIKVSWMNKVAEKNIRKNPTVDFFKIEQQVKAIGRAYTQVNKGDNYTLSYDAKKQTTTLFLNDNEVIQINGSDFSRAYFGIWLGPYSANQELCAKLLNQA